MRSRLPRWALMVVATTSLVLLCYAGVLLAFSVRVDADMARANPEADVGSRAVITPLANAEEIRTRAEGGEGSLLLRGQNDGALPSAAKDTRLGRALVEVPAGAEGTVEVDGRTLDLATLSGGAEGWILQGGSEAEPWFSPREETIGVVVRFETTGELALLFATGGIGFVAPLVTIVVTHRGAAPQPGAAPTALCRECHAPLQASAEFCMRCGAWAREERHV